MMGTAASPIHQAARVTDSHGAMSLKMVAHKKTANASFKSRLSPNPQHQPNHRQPKRPR